MILVYPDLEALSRAAADLFAERVGNAIADHGRCAILLAGGETPRRTYELLADEPLRSRVPWGRLHLFWGDERSVASDDPRSNAQMVRRALLDRVPVPAGQVHPIPGDRDPRQSADEYEELLHRFFAGAPPRFDLVVLGLGDDGHTASLFPDSPVLEERERWASATRRAGEEIGRVTLTVPLINQAELVVFLVAGDDKATILREVLEEYPDPRSRPARMIRPEQGELRWLVDASAARLLHRTGKNGNLAH
ncbi:6-phosphogluconolactonase [Geobacter sp. AOG2]|uniref:6-phosphogluconolactonase n=1 Tax=Geobacter sp. AOG2 TaxID=1566347 RepID=UPI001CC617FA|nr:6-phosphogluconolactonase [Geobacter sp. AOG2]GFE60045.1 6-phosphogluconolactonase [Geobacter sp. AOG2]